MRYMYLLLSFAGTLAAQDAPPDGAAIYKERCASCHDAPQARVPSLSTIRAMTGQAIYVALTGGAMKSQAAGLSTLQLFALIGYIAPTGGAAAANIEKTCKGTEAFSPASGPNWNGWSPGVTNSRFQDAKSAGLTAAGVSKLKVKWAFNLGAITGARSQPAIVGARVFVASQTGVLYSLDAHSGCTWWGYKAAAGIRSGVTLGDANGVPAVFFPDGGGTLYALNADTGELIWKTKPASHWATAGTATPRFYKGVLYQPFASIEEALAADPSVQCCTFRGSVVALEAATGKKLWESFTILETPKPTGGKLTAQKEPLGPSGAGIWSSPTIDEKLGLLYVATGDNYSAPTTNTSDALLAMELKTGKLVWSRQLTENDAYNVGCSMPAKTNCPDSAGPDFDFGQSPILVDLPGGKRALVIGQKSGLVHAVDPDQGGKVLWQTRVGQGSALGGSQWGSASDGRLVYVAISDIEINGVVPDPKRPEGYHLTLNPKKGGGLHALDVATGRISWSAKPAACQDGRTDCSPAQSAAVTAIPGVVFSGAVDGHLRAYSAESGSVLWDTDTAREFSAVNGGNAHGGSIDVAGPAVVDGMVFVNSGYGQWGGMPGNVLLAFSVDGK
jgi:polyvinyl alcohol dehydrogenase (cytochrome)